jgi:hypothetical protein
MKRRSLSAFSKIPRSETSRLTIISDIILQLETSMRDLREFVKKLRQVDAALSEMKSTLERSGL